MEEHQQSTYFPKFLTNNDLWCNKCNLPEFIIPFCCQSMVPESQPGKAAVPSHPVKQHDLPASPAWRRGVTRNRSTTGWIQPVCGGTGGPVTAVNQPGQHNLWHRWFTCINHPVCIECAYLMLQFEFDQRFKYAGDRNGDANGYKYITCLCSLHAMRLEPTVWPSRSVAVLAQPQDVSPTVITNSSVAVGSLAVGTRLLSIRTIELLDNDP